MNKAPRYFPGLEMQVTIANLNLRLDLAIAKGDPAEEIKDLASSIKSLNDYVQKKNKREGTAEFRDQSQAG